MLPMEEWGPLIGPHSDKQDFTGCGSNLSLGDLFFARSCVISYLKRFKWLL